MIATTVRIEKLPENMKIVKVIIFFILLALFLIVRESSHPPLSTVPIAVRLNGLIVEVETAYTEQARYLGLSNRKSLGEKNGLLMVFDEEGEYGIVMRDMNFSIDVIWIDDDFKIVTIAPLLRPSFKGTAYPSAPARYVLEVNAGLTDEHDIKEGDEIQFIIK